REALEHFQISPNLTNNIMLEVARLKPTPSGSKPFLPWAVAASTAVLIALMLGIGNQHLARFQKPYSLEAQSEMSVELLEAPIIPILELEPDVRRQFGNINAVGNNDTPRQKTDEVLLASANEGKDVIVSKQQWIQSAPITGSYTAELLATSNGDLYSYKAGHLYKLPADGKNWQHLFELWTLNHTGLNIPVLGEWNNTLYYTQSSELFASMDDAKTWNLVYSWEETYSNPQKLILMDHEFYIAFDNGIFRSNDHGETWNPISDEGFDGSILALAKVQNTLFAGTDNGLYRLDTEGWKHLEFPEPIDDVYSVATTENMIYVLAWLERASLNPAKVSRGHERGWGLFSSSNLGNRWHDITPINAWAVNGIIPSAKLIATGDTVLLMERGMVRSDDRGLTWTPPQLSGNTPEMESFSPSAVVNADTIYVGGCRRGLHRSTDYGKSWEIVNITSDNENDGLYSLMAVTDDEKDNNTPPSLYGIAGAEGIKTTDKGKSWKDVPIEISMSKPFREDSPNINQIAKSGDILYASVNYRLSGKKVQLYKLSSNDSRFLPIQDIPIFDSYRLERELERNLSVDHLQTQVLGASQFFKQLVIGNAQQQKVLIQRGLEGAFDVSGDTFYMEYNYKLFRWNIGDTEWYDTGLETTVELSESNARKKLKLDAFMNTVYVGKRDGKLMGSFDKGTNWIDFTSALPFPVKNYNQILATGTTVYVATDAGVATSENGKNWQALVDAEGTNLVMERLAVDENTLYGVTLKSGIYRLENGSWNQVFSDTPEDITSMAVDDNVLYIGTYNRGMLHYTLE
ncbi:PQQ-binding-like beta-propeller repeat protein, partial [Candidatus Poribacteria bacterium]|nr:PQQ-binding-like beta-propeller repeat protein [Candidatus Poribacteria bacterium]